MDESGHSEESVGGDVLAMSFLDVLSCGLGGAICLFLIFSVLPHAGQRGMAATGSEEELRSTVGAKFRDFRDVVRNAIVNIEVEFDDKNIDGSSLLVRGQDRKQRVIITGKGTIDVILPGGVNPQRPLAVFLVADPGKSVEFSARVAVGRSDEHEQEISGTVTTSSDKTRLFRIDFAEDNWIKAN